MKNDQDVMKLIEETGVDFVSDESEQMELDTFTYRPRIIDPSKVKRREIDWLWPNKFQRGAFSIIAGRQGIGKSVFTCYMAAVLSNGWEWCDGTQAPECSVIFFCGEDDIASGYIPRLQAQGAVLNKIRFLDAIEELQGEDVVDEMEVTVKHVEHIAQAIAETEEATGLPVGMVVLDPFSDYLGEIRENNNAEMRKGTRSIRRMAKELNVALIGIEHHNKALSLGAAMNRATGSIAKTSMARSAWSVYPDTQNPGQLLFVPTKGNHLVNPKGLRFIIMPPDARVDILESDLEMTGDDCEIEQSKQATEAAQKQRQPEKLMEAENWLHDLLSEGRKAVGSENNPIPGSVYSESIQAGHAWGTVLRAQKELGVIKQRDLGVSFWSLPDSNQVAQF